MFNKKMYNICIWALHWSLPQWVKIIKDFTVFTCFTTPSMYMLNRYRNGMQHSYSFCTWNPRRFTSYSNGCLLFVIIFRVKRIICAGNPHPSRYSTIFNVEHSRRLWSRSSLNSSALFVMHTLIFFLSSSWWFARGQYFCVWHWPMILRSVEFNYQR